MPMKTTKLESSVGQEKEFKTWGITVRDISRAYANERQLDDDKGVVVTGLSPGYPAAKAELQNDDVVLRINEKDVQDLDEFTKIYDESVKNKDATVPIDFKRRRSSQQTVLKVTYAP
jgi:serine protease Do